MILPKDKNIYAVVEAKNVAYLIGSTRVFKYDPYTKTIGRLIDEYDNYTFGLILHNLNNFEVTRCRKLICNFSNSFLLIGE